jgi:ankyrin repeat protein
MVSTLLKAGADCNYQNKSNGWTSLFYAIHTDDYSLVQILLGANAEKNLEDWSGRTAMNLAEELECDIETLFGDSPQPSSGKISNFLKSFDKKGVIHYLYNKFFIVKSPISVEYSTEFKQKG